MDANTFILNQQMRRLTSEAASARGRVLNAPSMDEVVRHASLIVPPLLRFMQNQLSPVRSLAAAADRRLNELLDAQLQHLNTLELAAAEQAVLKYRRNEWQCLRGTWAAIYRKADFESRRLLQHKREASSASE